MKSQLAFSVSVQEDLCRASGGNCKGQRVSQSASFLRCFVITPLTSSRGTVVVATAHVQRKSKRDTHTLMRTQRALVDPLNYWSALRASHVSVSRRRAALPPLLSCFGAQVCLYRCLHRAPLLTSDLNLSNQLPFGWFELWTCSVNWSRVAAVLTEAESLSWVAFSCGAELKSI